MRRWAAFTSAIALGLALLGGATVAVAHEGEAGEEILAVEPDSITAGDTVVLAGSGLEPDSDRVLVLAGGHLVVEFGTVRTDAEGMFQTELKVPSHLPSGAYELRAIGDETLTAALEVTAATGAAPAEPSDPARETILPRDRSPIELVVIFAAVALVLIAGAVLVLRAERLGGSARL